MADDVGSSHVRTDFGELSDAELVRATRGGSRRAYATLWKRHSVSALKYARTLTPSDADDVVSEAFLKVYAAIQAGRGPEDDFRYYIRSAVRNTYVSMVRARRSSPAGDAIEDVVGDRGAEIASVRSFDGSATVRAFSSLPARWQEVLWYTEVEGLSRERTAAVLGINANAVSALAFRAREALRTAWLQEHISTRSDLDRGCGAITPLLGAYSRRGLSRRDRLRVEHHIAGCEHCTAVVGELSELLTPGRLALVLLPVGLAGGGFAAFASKAGGGSAVLASASTLATPAATVAATVGGGAATGAATGVAALTVVGKVAACALVATMIVPPTQMLIEAAHHPVGQTESAASHTDTAPDQGGMLHVSTVVALAEDAASIPPGDDADEATDLGSDAEAGDSETVSQREFFRGSSAAGTSADFGGSANPRADGAEPGDSGRPISVGKASPASTEKADADPVPTEKADARTVPTEKAGARTVPTEKADARTVPTEKAGASSIPKPKESAATASSPAGSPSAPTTAATKLPAENASARPDQTVNRGSAASAGARDEAPADADGSVGETASAAANAKTGGPAGPADIAGDKPSGAAPSSSGGLGAGSEQIVPAHENAPSDAGRPSAEDPDRVESTVSPAAEGMPEPPAAGLAAAAEAPAGG